MKGVSWGQRAVLLKGISEQSPQPLGPGGRAPGVITHRQAPGSGSRPRNEQRPLQGHLSHGHLNKAEHTRTTPTPTSGASEAQLDRPQAATPSHQTLSCRVSRHTGSQWSQSAPPTPKPLKGQLGLICVHGGQAGHPQSEQHLPPLRDSSLCRRHMHTCAHGEGPSLELKNLNKSPFSVF